MRRVAVVYRGRFGESVVSAMDEYFPLEPVEIRGIGMAYRYEAHDSIVYITRLSASYEANVHMYEKILRSALGALNEVISINPHVADPREGIFVHSAGNIMGEGYAGFSPLSLSPTSPSFIGTFILAVEWVKEEMSAAEIHVEATHDLPVDAKIPYVSVEYRGNYADELALALGASLGRRGRFTPYLTIGMSYYADEFIPLVKRKRIVPAYHIPVYMAGPITTDVIERLKKAGWIKGVLTGKGVPEDFLAQPVGPSEDKSAHPVP